MEQLKYEFQGDKRMEFILTICPYGIAFRVGSWLCEECVFNEGIDKRKQIVKCNYKDRRDANVLSE